MKPALILCLGNEVVSDDGFGAEVAARAEHLADVTERADVLFAPVAGFALLDLLAGRARVLVVDTIRTGTAAPGTLHRFPAGMMTPSRHLCSSHQISLPTALRLGELLGAAMPARVDVVAVEAQDVETLSEKLTPAVAAAVDDAVQEIRQWLADVSWEDSNHGFNRANRDIRRAEDVSRVSGARLGG